jgi:GNAT superfamily N-acetyltransferase
VVKLRSFTPQDIQVAGNTLRAMLEEMAAHGGDMPGEEETIREWFEESLQSALEGEDHLVLLAQAPAPEDTTIGLVQASLSGLHPVFAQQRLLHIHAVYVEPHHRRQGVGRQLVEAAMQWGRDRGCKQAELNVLAGNPARKLYEALGFEVFELEMRRGL